MDVSCCPACGDQESAEQFTVDRLGLCHWFRQCLRCGHRWVALHADPARDNPYDRIQEPAWRPDPPAQMRPV